MIDTTANGQATRPYGFAIGLMMGTCVGAGLVMWLAPNAASASVGEAMGDVARSGRNAGDEVAASVARGAHEVARAAQKVEQLAMSAAGDRT